MVGVDKRARVSRVPRGDERGERRRVSVVMDRMPVRIGGKCSPSMKREHPIRVEEYECRRDSSIYYCKRGDQVVGVF